MSLPYDAPLGMMRLAIGQAARSSGLGTVAALAEALELTDALLESAARLAREVLSPLNRSGDAAGARLTHGTVATAPGFRDAYARFRSDGWAGFGAPREVGGQGLPALIAAAVTEMWGGANLAFAMCPEVAVGVSEALRVHADASLRQIYLPPLVSGAWAASMCLTEPQAGSDLSGIRTLAEPDGAAWRVRGRKIFISWGDHDLTENIVHLVLARTPDAPAGVRGLSLFVVPKRLPQDDGTLTPNDIRAVSIEHKMGIRASPTCVMALGDEAGARGFLLGRRHEGLACMFSIMNPMRLAVGLHSIGLAERALQLARAHALERVQGRGPGGEPLRIIEHADVRRMLLTMKSLTHAARALAYHAAAALDVSRAPVAARERARAERRVALLTPLVKAWSSELAVEVASLGVQVHGGMGFIDECEASQIYRDARIGPIFEGTNYIQAQDLLTRKVIRDGGEGLEELLAEIQATAEGLAASPHAVPSLTQAVPLECAALRAAAGRIRAGSSAEPELVGSVASSFLHWLGLLAGAWQWMQSVLECSGQAPQAELRAVLACARLYGTHILPRTHAHRAAVEAGPGSIADADSASR